jgi:uncharacterized RDD family membrane protein YckC
MVWYYARGGQRQGPVEDAEIQQLAASGQIAPGDLVWRSGLPDWRPAGEVPEIARFLRPVAPPPPPPPPAPVPSYNQTPAPYAQSPAPAPYTPPPPAAYTPPPSPYAPPSAPLTQSPAYGPMPLPGTPSPFGAITGTEYASFGARLAALLIDQVIVFIAAAILGFGIGVLIAVGGSTGLSTGAEGLLNIMGIVITWLYYAGFESSAQMGTPGKRALGLRVTDMQGQRIDFARATGRYFGKIISALLLGIGFLMMLSDERKQTLHDKMASCLVLKQR